MSDWTGKGSKSRVTNYNNYWNSARWNNKSKDNKKCLVLDDQQASLSDEKTSLSEASGVTHDKLENPGENETS